MYDVAITFRENNGEAVTDIVIYQWDDGNSEWNQYLNLTATDTEIELKAPFVEWSKTDIAERGLELDVPYDMTWSCYRDEEPACGTCDACAVRLEAFLNAGSRDPIAYAERPKFS